MMRIPGPSDLFGLAGKGYEAAEQAIALVPRLVKIVTQVEQIVPRVAAMLSDIEQTQKRANGVVARTEGVVSRAELVVDKTDSVVDTAVSLTGRIIALLNRFEPALVKLEPVLTRLAETTNPDEIAAVVKLIDLLPEIVGKVDKDILPILDTLGTVAPDLRDLLDVSKELNELIGSVPGLGRVKKKIEEKQELADNHRADEQSPAAAEGQ